MIHPSIIFVVFLTGFVLFVYRSVLLERYQCHQTPLQVSSTCNYSVVDSYQEIHEVTLVSAYFDITRVGRPKEDYFTWLNDTLKLNGAFVFYTEDKYINIIKNLIPKGKLVKIIRMEINELPYYKYLNQVKEIISNPSYRNRVQQPGRIECSNPLYSIVVFSKVSLLEKTTYFNPFSSKQFIWIDAGISRFYGNFTLLPPFHTKSELNDKFFTIFEDRALQDGQFLNKDNNAVMWSNKNYFQAGIMGGSSQVIKSISDGLLMMWNKMISNNVVNNEQIALLMLYFHQPYLFHFFNRSTLANMGEIFWYLTS